MKYVEIRGKLSIWGKAARAVFWIWNALMALWFLASLSKLDLMMSDVTDTTGQVAVAVVFIFLASVWICGAIALGLWVYFTRPVRALVPEAMA